ncbi:unnamed protein product [Sphenostylis stenocarpa]|uniref:RING-type E3 ubiquitin transferase n=1 Tax=Sphenostylis stenocarpa TaxID=92480 RepID=A0AA86SXN5_9FABA|nr:unnamed protein product [Sphenostylis stenocarpa]
MAPEGKDEPTQKFPERNAIPQDIDEKSYSLNGKIMFSAIVLLLFVVLVMLCLHIYARWYLRRARRRQLLRQRELRRTQLVFYNDAATPAAVSRGLDAAVLASLPVFTYDSVAHPDNAPECAVCLSEFKAGEPGRVLPKCNHSFHTECIDMWFHSHATCPLCRAPVERPPEPEVVITVREVEIGSISSEGENRTGSTSPSSSSVGSRKSLVGVTVEVPPREGNFRDEDSSSFRSPMSRMLSFTRILSRDRRGNVSPSSCGGDCSPGAQCDAERGGRDETQ